MIWTLPVIADAGAASIKPFDEATLIDAMRAALRHGGESSQPRLQVGPLGLDLGRREATINGGRVRLSAKEFAVLELLALCPGMLLTKTGLFNYLYGAPFRGRPDDPDRETPGLEIIDGTISRLRKKLAAAGAPPLIFSVWRRGYLLRPPAGQS